MAVLIALVAIAFLILWYYVAAEFRRIAAMKGYDEPRYLWWTFFLGLVGMLMVVALPQKAAAPAEVKTDELPEI